MFKINDGWMHFESRGREGDPIKKWRGVSEYHAIVILFVPDLAQPTAMSNSSRGG